MKIIVLISAFISSITSLRASSSQADGWTTTRGLESVHTFKGCLVAYEAPSKKSSDYFYCCAVSADPNVFYGFIEPEVTTSYHDSYYNLIPLTKGQGSCIFDRAVGRGSLSDLRVRLATPEEKKVIRDVLKKRHGSFKGLRFFLYAQQLRDALFS